MRVNFKYFALLLLLLIGMNSAFAQWDTTWIKTYGGNRDDVANDMILTPDNGFLMVGTSSSFGFDNSQMYFLKLDSIGNIMWSKSHGGPGQEHGTSLIQTSDGGYLGVGYTNSWGEGGFDIFLVKLDASGNLEYEAVKGGVDWDFAWDVIELSPGKYVIAGETQSFGNGNSDGWLLQFDEATKTWDWETTVGTSSTENLMAVTTGSNGSFYSVGLGHANTPNDKDIMVVKFDATGNNLWTKFYGDTLLDFGNDIIQTNDGEFAITGVRQAIGFNPAVAILKIDDLGTTNFDTIWSESLPYGEGAKIVETADFRLAISGTVNITADNEDMYLAYSYPSSFLYQKGSTLGGLNNKIERCNSLINLETGGFAISGETNGFNNTFTEILMYKTNVDGVTASNDFDNVKDSVNIVGIKPVKDISTKTSYNTALGEFTILSGTQDFSYSLYNLSGQLVNQGNLKLNQPTQLSPSAATGLYIIKAIGNQNSERLTQLIVLTN